ncbi:MAG TPA: hypothetical protein VFE47_20880 [Tepidisphaeraceae bacterium]|jgi:hypothetical protein|nr:hypothetical protein [Tepidisphaeraceae bacterium]
MSRWLPSFCVALIFLAGCHGSGTSVLPAEPAGFDAADFRVYGLAFRDPNQNQLAGGQIVLPVEIPPEGQIGYGVWKIDRSAKSFPADAARSGMVTFQISSGVIYVGFNPGAADNNLSLAISPAEFLKRGNCEGEWTHQTEPGASVMGTFILHPHGKD